VVGSGLFDTLEDDGTGWEPIAGGETADTLLVVRAGAVPVAGLVLSCLLVAIFLTLGWSPNDRRARRFLLAWLAVGGLALIWLPSPLRGLAWWPALTAVAAAVFWLARQSRKRVLPAPRSTVIRPATIATLLALIVVASVAGQAAAPAPTVVYLVPDAANDPDRMNVLAPAELMEQLQTLAKRGAASLRGAVLIGAAYEGRIDNQTAQMEARFQVHSFGEGAAFLTLPLGGVQLTDAMLDGAATQPTAVRQPRDGYTIEIKGRGSHTIVMRFSVPLAGVGDDRDLRFTIPRLPHSRLVLDVPASAGYLHAVEALGAQRTSLEDRGLRLHADVGAIDTLRVRWRRDGDQPAPTGVTVEESYYWDLQAASARLLAVLKYRVKKGWGTTFRIDLPRDLEVQSAEAGTLPGEPAAPRLRWFVREENGRRRLYLEFLGPVTGGVQVALEMVPRRAFGRTVELPFPAPVDDAFGPAFLAYRTDGVQASVAHHHAINDIAPERLPQAYTESFGRSWRAMRPDDPGQPSRAFTRDKGGVLHLILRAPAAKLTSEQDVTWTIGQRQSHLEARAMLKSADSSLSLVEWEVPPGLTAVEVAGAPVRSWSRAGNQLQIWLQKPAAEATLSLSGWLPRVPKEPGRWDLPVLRLQGLAHPTTLRLIAGDGLAIAPAALQNLVPRTGAGVPGRDLVYGTKDPDDYRGRFITSPSPARSDFYLLTFAEVRDRELWFVVTLNCPPTRADKRNLTITLRNWEGTAALPDTPEVVSRKERTLAPGGGHSWSVELQPNVAHRHQLTLTGSMRLRSQTEVPMPDVRVEMPGTGAVRLDRWVAMAGADLSAEDASGLIPEPLTSPALLHWPGEANRLRRARGTVWKVTGEDWRLRLRNQTTAAQAAPVEVYLTEHAAALADGRRWLHQTTYWLYHEAGTDLSVALPSPASVLAVSIDGVAVPPLQPGTERVWLPLTGGAGARVVRLSWAFADGQEPLDRPALEGPKLEGVAEGPVLWTVHVPPGYELSARDRGARSKAEPTSTTAVDLWRAAAQLRLSGRLAEQRSVAGGASLGPQLLTAQLRFERFCRLAEYQLGTPGVASTGSGPGSQPLPIWLQELREKYGKLSEEHRLDKLRTEEPAGAGTSLSPSPYTLTPFDRGQPSSWQTTAGELPPRLHLVSVAASRNRQAFAWSTLLVVLVLAIWILSHFFRTTWPEQLALVGFVGVLLFGSGWGMAFLLLPALTLGYRVIGLVRWAVGTISRRLAAQPEA